MTPIVGSAYIAYISIHSHWLMSDLAWVYGIDESSGDATVIRNQRITLFLAALVLVLLVVVPL
ncbi:hypothetical protein F4815DRAFT_481476 [Daldinia loculata]|nr:hypothetical protein F4815DRAFT_481476 [Daldinia loculata]